MQIIYNKIWTLCGHDGFRVPSPHLFSNRRETVQPLFWPTESTTIAIAVGVLQTAELEPLQRLLPEEGVLPGVKILCSKKRQII